MITIFSAALALSLAKAPTCVPGPDAFCGVEYVDNYGADLLEVTLRDRPDGPARTIDVRIAGIAAPRLKSSDPCERDAAVRARDTAHRWLKSAQRVDLVGCKRERSYRFRCQVLADGVSVREVLERDGSVLPTDGAPKRRDWCGYLNALARRP